MECPRGSRHLEPLAELLGGGDHRPRVPGVYVLRNPETQALVYVGIAGERAGSGRAHGLWGHLSVYRIGKCLASGYGEAAFDRALGDIDFVERQLGRLRAGEALRAKQWGIDAIEWWKPDVCWTTTETKSEAAQLERTLIGALEGSELWNRGPSRRRT